MKGIFLWTLGTIFSFCLNAQNNIVQWNSTFKKQNSELLLSATIQEGWHMYSQFVDENAGPVATSFEFSPTSNIVLVGKVVEPTPIAEYDANFEANVLYFENKVDFAQKLEVKGAADLPVSIVYMVCNKVMCLPPVEHKMIIPITLAN